MKVTVTSDTFTGGVIDIFPSAPSLILYMCNMAVISNCAYIIESRNFNASGHQIFKGGH